MWLVVPAAQLPGIENRRDSGEIDRRGARGEPANLGLGSATLLPHRGSIPPLRQMISYSPHWYRGCTKGLSPITRTKNQRLMISYGSHCALPGPNVRTAAEAAQGLTRTKNRRGW